MKKKEEKDLSSHTQTAQIVRMPQDFRGSILMTQ